jgi:hypothetical protein
MEYIIYDKNCNIKELNKVKNIHKSLTADDYLTHAIILQSKNLTDQQKEYHESEFKRLIEDNLQQQKIISDMYLENDNKTNKSE